VTIAELRKKAGEEGVNDTGTYVEWLEKKLLPYMSIQEWPDEIVIGRIIIPETKD